VWHEWRDGGFDVVTGGKDVKIGHLRRDPRANIVVYEHEPPYRGIEVHGEASLQTDGVHEAVKRIASRYLGPEGGAAYAESAGDDTLIRLEPGHLRAWDFSDQAI
jgi:hypothetical protein